MIKLNQHFLKQSIAVQKNALSMVRQQYACVFVEDVDTDEGPQRKYYCTDGHVLLFCRERIEEKQFTKPVSFSFDKLPKTKCEYYAVELIADRGIAEIVSNDRTTIEYNDPEHTREDCFESIKRILCEKEIKDFRQANMFTLFSDTVIKMVKDYLGVGLYCTLPKVKWPDSNTGPVFWHNSDCSMVAIAMPMRCGD